LRELRELVRRCDALKASRVQEMNRRAAGFASPAVAASIKAHIDLLDEQVNAVMGEVRHLVASHPALQGPRSGAQHHRLWRGLGHSAPEAVPALPGCPSSI